MSECASNSIARKAGISLHFLQFSDRSMPKLLISFDQKNVRLRSGRWLFERQWPMRFEWFALMAYKRLTTPADQAWVRLEEIARLPSWGGTSRHHTSTNVGRYLSAKEFRRFSLVEAQSRWSGPYRLKADPLSLEFDCSLSDVRHRLQLRPQPASTSERAELLQFAMTFSRAHSLIFRGRLMRDKGSRPGRSAYDLLMGLVERRSLSPTLQMLALLAGVDVLFRLSRFQVARTTLMRFKRLLGQVDDASLKARFHLKLAWAFQRGSSGKRSDHAVEGCLERARFYAESSGDRATLGLLALRTAGYRTKKGRHLEAINQLVLALEADLITGNYDSVQIACGDLGSVVHRLGLKHYDEARRWLLVSIAIARMMNIGRDDAHAEMILGKIYLEQKNRFRSRWLLARAERIAERAGNRVNLADIKMVWGFWYEEFGTRKQLIETLRAAVVLFRSLSEFDARQKERYLERKFPIIWQEVIEGMKPLS